MGQVYGLENPAVKYNIRPEIKASIDRYATARTPTGNFLRAVLSNDLQQAFALAGYGNIEDMQQIVSYCHNEIPSNCWGSPQEVAAWLKGER